MTEIMPVPRNLSFTVLPAGRLAPPSLVTIYNQLAAMTASSSLTTLSTVFEPSFKPAYLA